MTNLIVSILVIAAVALAVGYLIRARRRGVTCVGCPSGGCGSCKSGSERSESCSCGCGKQP